MSHPSTRRSQPPPAFLPMNTLDKAPGDRSMQYSRKARNDVAVSSALPRSAFRKSWSIPPSPYEPKSDANNKRHSMFPQPLNKKMKTGPGQWHHYKNSSSADSEDELQRMPAEDFKPTSAKHEITLAGHEDSFRSVEAMMSCSSRSTRASAKLNADLKAPIPVRAKDEQQQKPQLVSQQPVAKSKVPETFISDSDDLASDTTASPSGVEPITGKNSAPYNSAHLSKSNSRPDDPYSGNSKLKTGLGVATESEVTMMESPHQSSVSLQVPDSQPFLVSDTFHSTNELIEDSQERAPSLVDSATEFSVHDSFSSNNLEPKTSDSTLQLSSLVKPKGNAGSKKKKEDPSEFCLAKVHRDGANIEARVTYSIDSGWLKLMTPKYLSKDEKLSNNEQIFMEEKLNIETLKTFRYDIDSEDAVTLQLTGPDNSVYELTFSSPLELQSMVQKIRNIIRSRPLSSVKVESIRESPREKKRLGRPQRGSVAALPKHTAATPSQTSKRFKADSKDSKPKIESDVNIRPPLKGKESLMTDYPYTFQLYEPGKEAWTKPLEFPASGPSRAIVDFSELPYLDHDEWLNDSLVWFGIKYCFEEHPELKGRIYYFNTYFYQTLTNLPPKGSSTDSSKQIINYEAVRRWTLKADVNLFNFDHIVVPIHLDSHWFLAIIANVKNFKMEPINGQNEQPDVSSLRIQSPNPVETNSPNGRSSSLGARSKADPTEPVIITLDSMGNPHPTVVRALKTYLQKEAEEGLKMKIPKQRSGITAKNIPLQTNGCDCGLFLIGFVKKFLQEPDGFVSRVIMGQMKLDFWPKTFADKLRADFRELVLETGYEQNGIKLDPEVKTEPNAWDIPTKNAASNQPKDFITFDEDNRSRFLTKQPRKDEEEIQRPPTRGKESLRRSSNQTT